MKKTLLCLLIINNILIADFIRDNKIGTITNNTTKLMWQDNSDVSADKTTWQNAVDRCEILTLGGYNNWRLPNKYELSSLADENRFKHGIYPVFQNVGSKGYWSITVDTFHSGSAWFTMYTCGGGHWHNKMSRGHVRCVRNIK